MLTGLSARTSLCEKCSKWIGAMAMFNVHHIQARSGGGSDDLVNLAALCLDCHDWVHSHPKEARATGWLK